MRATLPLILPQSAFRNPKSEIASVEVDSPRVVAHHPVAVEGGRERAYGVARHLYPAARQARRVPLVEGGHDLILKHSVERVRVARVRVLRRLARRLVADGPAVAAVVAFE